MRILLTNDDGVRAPGLEVLIEIAREISDDIWTVAPELDQSGAAHSLTLNDPLRSRQIGERIFSVTGTPTDCVIMALRHIMLDNPPDLVLSGVNRGQNIAEDVTYSGTIAGAIEGSLLGIPSIALSQAMGYHRDDPVTKWETARHHAPGVIRRLLEAGWPEEVLVNVNFPDCAPEKVEGIEVTRQGRRDPNLMAIEDRMDTRGNPYYWLAFQRQRSKPAKGTDLWAVYNDMISVTPLYLNLTHDETREALNNTF